MGYFFSHIGYILIASVLIGLLGFAAVFFAEKSAACNTSEDGGGKTGDGAEDMGCGFNCASCMRFDRCDKDGKVVPLK